MNPGRELDALVAKKVMGMGKPWHRSDWFEFFRMLATVFTAVIWE